MLIVPFGYDLETMVSKFKNKVRELDQTTGIFGAGEEKVEFDRIRSNYPIYVNCWDEIHLVYYPKQYDKDNHGGLCKEDAIKINGAWQICFVEDMAVIPENGKIRDGRMQIDRKASCIKGQTKEPSIEQFHDAMQDKKKMKNPTKYKHEKGQTPEQYLWMQLTSLLDKEKPILMDYENGNYRGSYFTECYNIVLRVVLIPGWDLICSQIELNCTYPNFKFDFYGFRPSMNIMK